MFGMDKYTTYKINYIKNISTFK